MLEGDMGRQSSLGQSSRSSQGKGKGRGRAE